MGYLEFGCRCLLLVVFAGSALGKLSGAEAFAAFRRATAQLFPPARGIATGVGVAIIVAELTIVAMLGVAATVQIGLLAGLVLLTAFTVAIAAALRRGNRAPCHCFGRSNSPLGARHLVRNAFLVFVAGAGLAAEPASTGPATTEPLGIVMAGLAAVVLAALVLYFDALAELFLERIPT